MVVLIAAAMFGGVVYSIEQKLPGANIMIEHVGPVIGAHAGPGTVALCFIGKEIRKP